jgi:hypothetical protein
MKTLKAPPLTTILHQHLLECTDPQRTLHAIDKEVRGSSLSESYIGADPLGLLQTVERVFDACVPDLRIDYSALTRTAEGIWEKLLRHSRFQNCGLTPLFSALFRIIDEMETVNSHPTSTEWIRRFGCTNVATIVLDLAIAEDLSAEASASNDTPVAPNTTPAM